MLRSTRLLLLLAIVLIIGGVGATFYRRRANLNKHVPPPPKTLPVGTAASAVDWSYAKYDGQGRKTAEVRAKEFRQVENPPRMELENVELRLFKPDGKSFNQIRSAKATLDQANDSLYSDGQVDITMDVPAEGPPRGRLMNIRSSGVHFDVKSGKATTDREATFSFDMGDGKAVGAVYDPNLRELIMKSQVELHWRGSTPGTKPMKLEAGELTYREADSVVLLPSWARLTREGTELNANDSVVTLLDGAIQKVEGKQARGTALYPNRRLEYAADHLIMLFAGTGEVERILGDNNAQLVSTSDTTRTATNADHVDMTFDASGDSSTLKQALVTGRARMEAVPLPKKGAALPETRRLRSEVIIIKMRPGGREVSGVDTGAPGQLEFVPNSPGQRHRTLDAERLSMVYGASNRPESFGAYRVATRTDNTAPDPPTLTWSDDLRAVFDPASGQMTRLEQWANFRYEEGDRRARAQRAVLDQARNLITLDQQARVWDPTGSTAADHILIDQKSGEMTADGNVTSTRQPDRKGNSSSMLANDEPLNAKARRMRTSEKNSKIRYEGQVVAWQGANRIWADTLDIDRAARRLVAHGSVKTQFLDQQKGQQKASKRAPAFIVVTSSDLVYTEADRVAHYTGGTHLQRPDMDVKASQIRAFLNDSQADSSLDHAIAEGAVHIVRTAPDRTLKGSSEHAEYFTADQKIVLTRGDPTMVDTARGYTKGAQLTYWANDDKLLVDGVEKQPARSLIKRR